MRYSAIIFGGIGSLVETSDIQRLAFNDAFETSGIDYYWDIETYQKSLSSTGGQARLSSLRLNNGETLTPAQIIEIHSAKTENYIARMTQANLVLRPGVSHLIQQAQTDNVRLAWATSTSIANIDGLINATQGALSKGMFAFIGNNTLVQYQKPDPEIYRLALTALGLRPSQALAIEDSVTGVTAAKAAGLTTIAFPGAFNMDKDFNLADEVVSDVSHLISEFVA